jgi:chemotaxis protein CheD
MLRKLFWKNGIMINGQDVGGNIARTMFLEVASGRTWLQSRGREWDL